MSFLIKTHQEIAKARKAGKVVGKILATLSKMIEVGNHGKLLAKKAREIMAENSCQPSFLNYHGFPDVICVSINEQLIHGIPNFNQFKAGDLVSIDVGCQYQGMHADAALTKLVGKGTLVEQKLLKTTADSLGLVIKKLRPGKTIGDIGYWINDFISKKNYHLTTDYGGHGIGTNLHEDPLILNVGQPHQGLTLEANMLICVEPMVLIDDSKTKVLADGWTVVATNGKKTCHFEHTILITESGGEVLTRY